MNLLSIGAANGHLPIQTADERQQQVQREQRNQHKPHETSQNKSPQCGRHPSGGFGGQ